MISVALESMFMVTHLMNGQMEPKDHMVLLMTGVRAGVCLDWVKCMGARARDADRDKNLTIKNISNVNSKYEEKKEK